MNHAVLKDVHSAYAHMEYDLNLCVNSTFIIIYYYFTWITEDEANFMKIVETRAVTLLKV